MARGLAAVVIVAAVAVGLAGTSAPVSAQAGSTPTFSDPQFYRDVPPGSDPTGVQSPYRHIQSLARAGVFEGTDCGARRFCPDAHVQRWQMAVWLMRSLGEEDLDPIRESRFSDVDPGSWWAPYVERAAELGFTGGCARGPLRFCPNAAVDRGQAATAVSEVLDRFLPDIHGVDPVGFTDLERIDPDAGHVDRVVTFQIMEACDQDPLQFCRREDVTKAQMAAILFRSLDWLQLNTIAESSPVPDDIFLTEYNAFSWHVKTNVVDEYGDDYPWLKTAWNATNWSRFRYMLMEGHSGFRVNIGAAWPHVGRQHLQVRLMTTSPHNLISASDSNPSIIHELAHIYTLSNRVVSNPLPIAAAYLYFEELVGGEGTRGCIPYEIFADITRAIVFYEVRHAYNHYWGMCPNTPAFFPTEEAMSVTDDAFSGRVPQWFYDRFQQPGGSLDYERIWAAVSGIDNERSRKVVIYHLRDYFGGFCPVYYDPPPRSERTIYADPGVTSQPWVDGGCSDSASTNADPSSDSELGAAHTAEFRITARRLADGRIEFGLQQRDTDSWGERRLPRVRFFPTSAGTNRWLVSSPLDLTAGDVRIVARRLADGRIEFGLQQRDTDTWGERRLPRVRFFPTSAGTDRWLVSSPLTLEPVGA